MSANEQYDIILNTLAEKIKDQQTTIFLQRYQIEDLEKRLAEAERRPNPNGEKADNT